MSGSKALNSTTIDWPNAHQCCKLGQSHERTSNHRIHAQIRGETTTLATGDVGVLERIAGGRFGMVAGARAVQIFSPANIDIAACRNCGGGVGHCGISRGLVAKTLAARDRPFCGCEPALAGKTQHRVGIVGGARASRVASTAGQRCRSTRGQAQPAPVSSVSSPPGQSLGVAGFGAGSRIGICS